MGKDFDGVILLRFFSKLLSTAIKIKIVQLQLGGKVFEYGFGQLDVNFHHFYHFNILCI